MLIVPHSQFFVTVMAVRFQAVKHAPWPMAGCSAQTWCGLLGGWSWDHAITEQNHHILLRTLPPIIKEVRNTGPSNYFVSFKNLGPFSTSMIMGERVDILHVYVRFISVLGSLQVPSFLGASRHLGIRHRDYVIRAQHIVEVDVEASMLACACKIAPGPSEIMTFNWILFFWVWKFCFFGHLLSEEKNQTPKGWLLNLHIFGSFGCTL